ncbi:ImpA family metalloprotease [Leptothrix sp. BB-4]
MGGPVSDFVGAIANSPMVDVGTPMAMPAAARDALDQLRRPLADMGTRIDLALRQIYLDSAGHPLDTSLTYTNGSISFPAFPRGSDRLLIPLAQGRGGAVMAYAFEHPTGQHGRGLVYGVDMLSWMVSGSDQVQHRPLFKQAWLWALHSNTEQNDGLRFVSQGHDAAVVSQYLIGQLGRPARVVSCDLAAVKLASACSTADVFVVGNAISDEVAIRERIAANVTTLLEAGKTVMYFAPSTWNNSSPGTNALLMSLGEIGPVEYPGNFFACPDSCEAVTSGSIAELNERFNWAVNWQTLVDMLAGKTQVPEIAQLTTSLQLIDWAHEAIRRMQDPGGATSGAPPARSWETLLSRLADWGDAWRPQVLYGPTIDKTVDRTAFLRAYTSDSWVINSRSATTVPRDGAGIYIGAKARTALKPIEAFETLDVTIAQENGITLIGRAAVPGKLVEIEIADPAHASSLSVQSSYMRTWARPLAINSDDPKGFRYHSPRRPGSWPVRLQPGVRNTFITPFGGPLMLSYGGAKVGDVVKLRVRGAAAYAHIDFTQPSPVTEAQIAEMAARIKEDAMDWMTFKFVGGEVQQKITMAGEAMSDRSLSDYLRHSIATDVVRANHWANGYNEIPRSATVSSLCSTFQWDCSSSLHSGPGVQHFVAWIPACGNLCSGEPIDADTGFNAGWGTAHELGHNTVQRVHAVSFIEPDFDTGKVSNPGCFTECDNNILSVVTGLAAWARDRTNIGTGRVGTREFYVDTLLPVRAEAARLRLSPEKARQLMGTRLWATGSDRARWGLHFQLGALYAKYRHPDSPKVGHDMMFDFLAMLTMGDRLVSNDWSPAKASRYGMGRYSTNNIGSHEVVYVLSSKIIGRDLRRLFTLYGIPLSATALDSVADLGLPVAPLTFFAFPDYAPTEGVWLDLEGNKLPTYPFDS